MYGTFERVIFSTQDIKEGKMMEKEEKFTINVTLNGRKIPLAIPRKEDEELIYRQAERLWNREFAGNSERLGSQTEMEEILLHLSYSLAVHFIKEKQNNRLSPFLDRIEILEKNINTVLNK